MIDNRNGGTDIMRKSISISIRVSEEELDKFKQAARLEAYASYSEFVRRTALIEAAKIIKKKEKKRLRAFFNYKTTAKIQSQSPDILVSTCKSKDFPCIFPAKNTIFVPL